MRSAATSTLHEPRKTIAHDTIRQKRLLLYEDDIIQATTFRFQTLTLLSRHSSPNPPKVGVLDNLSSPRTGDWALPLVLLGNSSQGAWAYKVRQNRKDLWLLQSAVVVAVETRPWMIDEVPMRCSSSLAARTFTSALTTVTSCGLRADCREFCSRASLSARPATRKLARNGLGGNQWPEI